MALRDARYRSRRTAESMPSLTFRTVVSDETLVTLPRRVCVDTSLAALSAGVYVPSMTKPSAISSSTSAPQDVSTTSRGSAVGTTTTASTTALATGLTTAPITVVSASGDAATGDAATGSMATWGDANDAADRDGTAGELVTVTVTADVAAAVVTTAAGAGAGGVRGRDVVSTLATGDGNTATGEGADALDTVDTDDTAVSIVTAPVGALCTVGEAVAVATAVVRVGEVTTPAGDTVGDVRTAATVATACCVGVRRTTGDIVCATGGETAAVAAAAARVGVPFTSPTGLDPAGPFTGTINTPPGELPLAEALTRGDATASVRDTGDRSPPTLLGVGAGVGAVTVVGAGDVTGDSALLPLGRDADRWWGCCCSCWLWWLCWCRWRSCWAGDPPAAAADCKLAGWGGVATRCSTVAWASTSPSLSLSSAMTRPTPCSTDDGATLDTVTPRALAPQS